MDSPILRTLPGVVLSTAAMHSMLTDSQLRHINVWSLPGKWRYSSAGLDGPSGSSAAESIEQNNREKKRQKAEGRRQKFFTGIFGLIPGMVSIAGFKIESVFIGRLAFFKGDYFNKDIS